MHCSCDRQKITHCHCQIDALITDRIDTLSSRDLSGANRFRFSAAMAIEMAKMICVLSKEPSHTLFLHASQEPSNAEQDTAWTLEVRYELNQVIITELGFGTTTCALLVTDRRECSRPIYKLDNTNKALFRFLSVRQLKLPNIERNDIKLRVGLSHGHRMRHPGSGGAGIRLGIQRVPGTMRMLTRILVQHVSRPLLCEYLVKILEFRAMYQGQKSVEQCPFREDWSVNNRSASSSDGMDLQDNNPNESQHMHDEQRSTDYCFVAKVRIRLNFQVTEP